jgi:hypothetical protein
MCPDEKCPSGDRERRGESIDDLIARSSIGAGLANIRENGIEAELAELERETKPRRGGKR